MKFSVEDFRNWEHKKITLLGMSFLGRLEMRRKGNVMELERHR